MWARRIARRWLPRRLRAELALLRRAVRDRRSGVAFALGRGERDAFPCAFEGYELPVIVYPGQERLAEGKRRNQRLMAEALDGARAEPGETFSLWRLAGRPSARRGYLAGAAIVNGRLTAEIGGATCLLSTVLYNAGLLAGLDVEERHAHSVDSYGEARYFEPGRDAAVEYGVLDLRFRNPHPFPVLLAIEADEARVRAAFLAPARDLPRVAIAVEGLATEGRIMRARTFRTVAPTDGPARVEDLGWSRYLVPDAAHFASAVARA